MKHVIRHFKTVDRKLDQLVPILLIVLAVFLIRLPSFAEPYWYGDEAIYLTIGNAMRHGERLYSQIVDHKTPIIYYLAMVPNQAWFRVLGLLANLSIILCLWKVTERFFIHKKLRWLTVAGTALLLNLPMLEGNIPNGETFVLFFVLWALVLFWESKVGLHFTEPQTEKSTPHQLKLAFGCGVFGSLAILTKVPALFDVAAIGFGFWLYILQLPISSWRKNLKPLLTILVAFVAGVAVPILLSIIYFSLRGSAAEYLQFGLLYNFRYAGNWTLPFTQVWLVKLFSLPVKAGLLGASLLFISVLVAKKQIHPLLGWSTAWVLLTLVAATLSNRPYPHYFLQLVVPVILNLGLALDAFWPTHATAKHKIHAVMKIRALSVLMAVMSLLFVVATFQLLKVPFYPTVSYYQRFVNVMSGKLSWPEYQQSFDQSVEENYKATRLIRTDKNPYLFVWGTNPLIYATTGKMPTGRFTVLFHIRDFHAEGETIDSFKAKMPTYAVIMRNEDIPPDLYSILSQNYMISNEFRLFTLWRRIKAQSSL